MNAQDVIVAGLRAESRILSTESLHMLAEIALTAAGYAVVELPEPDEEDDDGQVYFDDGEIRVDMTGPSPTIWRNGREVTPTRLRAEAAALLAAANKAEAVDE